MKLILCVECSDVVLLKPTERSCSCGKVRGRYLNDLHAEVTGKKDKYFVLGFANSSLVDALWAQSNLGDRKETMGGIYGNAPMGREFKAFVIPDSAPTVVRREEDGTA